MIWLWADFNDIHHGNRATTLLEFAFDSSNVKLGSEVELYDGSSVGQGNRCKATVIDISGSIVELELDWTTWTPEEQRMALTYLRSESCTRGLGFSFEVTERFRSLAGLSEGKKTGELQHQ